MRNLVFFILALAIHHKALASNDDMSVEAIRKIMETNSRDELGQPQSASNQVDFTILEDKEERSDEMPQLKSNIFGHDFLYRPKSNLMNIADLPVPNDYKIGINDTLEILYSGSRNEKFELQVSLDGTILLPNVGKINILGDNVLSAKDKLNSYVKASYVGVDVDFFVKNLNAKKITIIGSIKEPGQYIVNPYTTISGALPFGGGLYDYSSLRKIKLIRSGEVYKVFDFYDLLVFGNRDNDIILESGDTILVDSTSNFVKISGEINRPMIYEYKSEDNFGDLVKFALGFSKYSNKEDLFVNERNGQVVETKEFLLSERINARALEEIRFLRKNYLLKKAILVHGNGVEEQYFAQEQPLELDELVSKLEFSDEVYPFFTILEQENTKEKTKEKIYFSINDSSSYQNISLKDNVKIMFFSRDDILENQFSFLDESTDFLDETTDKEELQDDDIDIKDSELEEVLKSIPKRFIKRASLSQEKYNLPIVGKVKPSQIYNYVGKIFDFNENLSSVSLEDGLKVRSFNSEFPSSSILQFNFPDAQPVWFEVEVSGQVRNPGTYVTNNKVSLNDLYTIAGGFTENADVKSIILQRNSIIDEEKSAINTAKENIVNSLIGQLSNPQNNSNLSADTLIPLIDIVDSIEFPGRLRGELSPDTVGAKSTFLQRGDKIIIPTRSNTVSVFGELMTPGVRVYSKNLTALDYIKSSGGLNSYADKNKIYILRGDGKAEPVTYRNLSKVLMYPGDSIIVPRNLDKLDTFPLIQASVKIISDIAFAAASLNVLRN